MGNIEFVGIINDFFNTNRQETSSNIAIPDNAHLIEKEQWLDMMSPLNWFIFGLPILIIILSIMAVKQKKNGILNKNIREEYIESNNKKGTKKIVLTALKYLCVSTLIPLIFSIMVIPIHELLHCLAGSLVGLNMKFGIDIQMAIAFAYSDDPCTKAQLLFMSLTPLFILGILPLLILFITYPKEKMTFKKSIKYWIVTFTIVMIIICGVPDIIESFNWIKNKNIPYNAIVEDDYWYIPNK